MAIRVNKGFIIIYDKSIYLELISYGIKPLSKHEGAYTEYIYSFNENTFELIESISEDEI